ncbi:phosphoglycerate mutase family protein [Fusobacterium gonidiaformans 3-1-5R]|uniref:Phosphoglycerate mutase family protein n=2 Tax=Fusobacterium TaxID=848 RepID=E5BEC9_9FUSO|nr:MULTISPECIES: histidine phosphatase family protein [Fusobacterium]EFS21405.1 phosphoglycerate mutase family protein [Fusobacterium gonidiaformans 3-1-5R]KXA12543.1 phosphoglycerate mutase family protein [Fusobacterium equinum]
MGKIILVRHGQTQMNADRIYFGKLNPPLNPLGKIQAHEAKKRLETEITSYDFIHASPLERTKETAEIVNFLGKRISFDERLEEINFGIFEGLKYHEIVERYPKEYEESVANWKTYHYETGESLETLQKRVVEYIFSLDLEKDHLIVTHWGVICSFLSYVMSENLESYWKFKILNGGVVILEVKDNFPVLAKLL